MDTAKIEGNQSLKEMAGELRLNFDSYLDNLDTFSMIEMKNREIDQMNIKQKNAENQLAKIERLLKSPYFGKVVVDFLDNEPKESFYIGTANFTDDADENLVYDWRSPIAELFYNNMIGPSSYTVRQNKIDTVIKERRQFLLERDRLVKFFDTSVAIQDNEKGTDERRKLLQKKYRKITRQIEEMAWVDEHQLFERIYEKRYGSAYAWQPTRTVDEAVIILAIRHLLVEKVNVPAFRYLLIDEVQDYTLAQLGLLIELFPKTHFTLVGDENQAIFNSSTTFADIMRCFDDYHLPIHRYDLRNSYRSSGAITELFKTYAMDQEKIDIVSIRPQGKEPEYRSFRSSEELLKILAEILVSLKGEKAAVITQTEEETQTLQESIKKNSYGLENCQIIPLSLAKGLEFDHVILYPFENDGDEQRRRRQMYTAISRGMKSIGQKVEQKSG